VNQIVLGLIHAAMPAITGYRAAARERLEACRTKDGTFWRVAAGLGQHASERYQSATLLIQEGRLWDAEILLRSAAEAVFKLLFIARAEEAERVKRLEEYSVTLSRIADLRQSERARSKLATLPGDSPDCSVFAAIVLPPEAEAQIRAQLPRKVRQALNAKWSFSEIIDWLDSTMTARGLPSVTLTILHTYGISSHVLHADERGLALVHDRMARDDDVRAKLENAHAARLLSDVIAFYALTVIALEGVAAIGDTQSLRDAHVAHGTFRAQTEPVHAAFRATQATMYRSIGRPYPTQSHTGTDRET